MKVLYKRKGGISAPVLAILTFAVLLVVGVAILMYFYVIAPQASHQSQLSVLGEPVIRYDENQGYVLTVTLKNIGSDSIEITQATIYINDSSYLTTIDTDEDTDGNQPIIIEAGEITTVTIIWPTGEGNQIPSPGNDGAPQENHLYTVILQTNFGNFEFSAIYRG